MQRDLDRLADILEAAEAIAGYLAGVDEDTFGATPLLQDAVLRRLTIIGEAAGKVNPVLRERFSNVPWRRIIGFRNFVVHEYQKVEWTVVWLVTQTGLPEMVPNVVDMVSALAVQASSPESP